LTNTTSFKWAERSYDKFDDRTDLGSTVKLCIAKSPPIDVWISLSTADNKESLRLALGYVGTEYLDLNLSKITIRIDDKKNISFFATSLEHETGGPNQNFNVGLMIYRLSLKELVEICEASALEIKIDTQKTNFVVNAEENIVALQEGKW
jgi:hypothetical protein